MHLGPNSSALRTPLQFFAGWGSRQRSSPTGGWANGMPLKLRMPSLGAALDSRTPLAIFTRSAADTGPNAAAQIAITERIDGEVFIVLFSLIQLTAGRGDAPVGR